jgi:dTMP kinase
MRPMFIAIEGIDGSGGTTQTSMLADWFRSRGYPEVLTTCEPSDGPVGQFIRRALDTEDPASCIGDGVLPFLFAADRRDHLDRVIVPALQRGAVVITDRYYHSSLAYQSLAVGLPAVAELNDRFQMPDVTIYLDLDTEVCLERIHKRGATQERFEALHRLREIRDAYESVVVHCRIHGERIERIDGRGTREAVHAAVVAIVETVVEAPPCR